MSGPLRSSTAKRSRRGRGARVTAIAALVSTAVLAAALGVASLAAPRLAEERIAAELAAAGLPGARFRVTRIDPRGVRVEDVVLGPDLRADAIDLELDLVSRRVPAITIRGARWSTALDADALRASTPARLLELASQGGDGGAGEPAIDRVRVEGAHLLFAHRGGTLAVALEADLEPRASRGWARLRSEHGELSLRGRLEDAELVLEARDGEGVELALRAHDAGDETRFSAEGEVPRALVALAAPGIALAEAPSVALRGVERSGVWSLEHGAVDAWLESARAGDDLEAHDVRLAVRATGELAPVLALDVEARAEARAARWADARFQAIAARPALRVDRDAAGELRARALRELEATVGTFALGTGDGEVRLHEIALTIAPDPARSLVRVDRQGVAHVGFSARASSPRARGAVRGRGIRARGDVELELGAAPRLRAPLEVEIATLVQPISEVTAHRVRSAVRLSLDGEGSPRAEGSIRAARTSWRDVALGATRGTIAISAERLALAFSGRATGAAPFHVAATIGLEEMGGRVDVRVPPSQVGAHDPLHRAILAATELRVLGRAGGEIHVGLGPRGRSSARLSLEGVTVDDPLGRGTARGVRGTIELAGLDPAVSVGADRLTWTALSLADTVSVRQGSALLRFEPSGEVSLEETEMAVGGGVVRIAPFSVDLEVPDVTLELEIEGVDVRRLAEVVSKGRVSGTGRLDGRVGVRVAFGEEPRLVLGRGTLSSRGPGRIRIRELPSASPLPTDVEVLQEGEWIQQRVLAALADFEYSRLALELGGPADGARTLHARVTGRGARTPQELDLTLNVRGVQTAIDHTLRLWQRGSDAITREPARRDRSTS